MELWCCNQNSFLKADFHDYKIFWIAFLLVNSQKSWTTRCAFMLNRTCYVASNCWGIVFIVLKLKKIDQKMLWGFLFSPSGGFIFFFNLQEKLINGNNEQYSPQIIWNTMDAVRLIKSKKPRGIVFWGLGSTGDIRTFNWHPKQEITEHWVQNSFSWPYRPWCIDGGSCIYLKVFSHCHKSQGLLKVILYWLFESLWFF